MKNLLTFIFLTCSISVIGQSTKDTTYAIMKIDTSEWHAKPAELTFNDLKELDKIISDFIEKNEYLLLDIKKYKRQYFPIINSKGEKEVWINCFCRHFDEDWRKKRIKVKDGGNCYFNFRVNLKEKKYYDFAINYEG